MFSDRGGRSESWGMALAVKQEMVVGKSRRCCRDFCAASPLRCIEAINLRYEI